MYNEFYNFSEAPFNLTPDPKFLFLPIGHVEALSSLLSGIKERRGNAVISGAVGTGKTTLIYALLKELGNKNKIAYIFYTKVSFRGLLKNILRGLDIPVFENKLTLLLAQFHQYLGEKIARDEAIVIIIDEAQNLEIEVLENLFRLCSHEVFAATPIQILLVGLPELWAKLDSQELQEFLNRVAIRKLIRPLNPKECEEYIDHRMKAVGSTSSEVFDPGAISRIIAFSGGIPRVINILCDHALHKGHAASKQKINEKIIKEVVQNLGGLKSPWAFGPREVGLWLRELKRLFSVTPRIKTPVDS